MNENSTKYRHQCIQNKKERINKKKDTTPPLTQKKKKKEIQHKMSKIIYRVKGEQPTKQKTEKKLSDTWQRQTKDVTRTCILDVGDWILLDKRQRKM